MAKKPSYLSTLNAIANGEKGGYELFRAWSQNTADKRLKPVLDRVAIREMEHSWAFTKRLAELGYELRPSTDASAQRAFKKQLKLMKSNASDLDKFASFGVGRLSKAGGRSQADALLNILSDKSIDPQTGELMGRFICEERDSGRQLERAYRALKRRQAKSAAAAKTSGNKKSKKKAA